MSSAPFSVLISVYEKEDHKHFNQALSSIFDQSLSPSEVVIVADGELTNKLESVIDRYKSKYPKKVQVVRHLKNQGLGVALQTGIKKCSNELVARMDADDISVYNRFELQVKYLAENENVDVIGGYISEFANSFESTNQIRKVPVQPDKIRKKSKFRCPVNHPSVMYRRSAVLGAGNYSSLRSMQDYELWMRMLSKGYTIDNIPQVLVKCRAGPELYRRRGGLGYIRTELTIQNIFFQSGRISFSILIINLLCRIPIRLLPTQIRAWIYQFTFRHRIDK